MKLVIDFRKGIHTESCDISEFPKLDEIRQVCKDNRFRLSIEKVTDGEKEGWKCIMHNEEDEEFVNVTYEELDDITKELLEA